MDFSSIQGAIAGLQTAGNMAKALVDIHDASVVKAKVSELQSAILAAQSSALSAHSEQFALLERVRDLETQIKEMEAWAGEKKRYQLTEVGQKGAFVYALKEGDDSTEPPHKICANCYNHGQKSVLQEEIRVPGMAYVLVCHNCDADIYTSGMWVKEHTKSRRSR